jgi:hypothetical protein
MLLPGRVCGRFGREHPNSKRGSLFGIVMRFPSTPFLLVLAGIVASSCTPTFDCEDTLISEHPSPDGRLIACVFVRDCGATTPSATHVCFRRHSDPFTPGTRASFLVYDHWEGPLSLKWIGPAKLVVELPPVCRSFVNRLTHEGVDIVYVQQNDAGTTVPVFGSSAQ